jgi:hypothetical protein
LAGFGVGKWERMDGFKGKFGFINKQGKVAIEPTFDAIQDFSEELAPVKNGTTWGYVDHQGAVVIDPKFDEVRPFKEGLAVVKSHGLFGYIDKKGNFAIEPKFDRCTSFSEGRAVVSLSDHTNSVDSAPLPQR